APTLPADNNLTPGTAQNYTGDRSIVVLAQETGGSIARGATTALTVTVGTYVGPVSPGTSSVPLTLGTTNKPGGSRTTFGFSTTTSYTQIEYNALGFKIASNEENGLWSRFGVDANGNIVKVDLYGTEEADAAYNKMVPDTPMAPITTYKQYD